MGGGGSFDNFIIKHCIGIFLFYTSHATNMLQNTIVKISTTTHFQSEINVFGRACSGVGVWLKVEGLIIYVTNDSYYSYQVDNNTSFTEHEAGFQFPV